MNDYHTRFRERFTEKGQFDPLKHTVADILAFTDEEKRFSFDTGRLKERSVLIKVVESLRKKQLTAEECQESPLSYPNDLIFTHNAALDAVLAHLRTGEEAEKGGSSFAGRREQPVYDVDGNASWIYKADYVAGAEYINLTGRGIAVEKTKQLRDGLNLDLDKDGNVVGVEILSSPEQPPSKPQDSIREGCCGRCVYPKTGVIDHPPRFYCATRNCRCHSPREEGGEKVKLLVQKFVEHWQNENPDLCDDIHELAAKITFFNAKWGMDFTLTPPGEMPAPTEEKPNQ